MSQLSQVLAPKTIPNPIKRLGRKPLFLTEAELKEAIQFYLTNDQVKKQSLLQKYGLKKLRHVIAICKLDMGRQGAIFKVACRVHGRSLLIYNWDNKEGVRVRCKMPDCNFNTHFMPFLFKPEEDLDFT